MPRDLFEGPSPCEPRPLWPHQERGLSELREALRRGSKRVMCAAPTGAGKTRLAAEIVRGALSKGRRVIFTVPALSLVEQTVEAFEAEGIDAIGVLQGFHDRTDTSQPVQVASVQTLERRAIPPADVVLIDEAHRQFAFVNRWLKDPAWADVPFVGLSATPWAKGLGKFFDALVVIATISELIDAGRLSPFRVYAPSHPDLKDVRVVAGEYHEGDVSDLMSDRTIVADVVETWKKLGPGNKTLCFAVDRAHASKLQAEFTGAGVDCAYIDAYTDVAEREVIKARFHEGRAEVVVSIGTMIAGIDWDVRCISCARPTKSEILWVQMFGRALRTADGKSYATILDHADNALRLGLPTDIFHAALDDGKPKTAEQKAREKNTPLPKECKQCGVLKPPRTLICPHCGFKPEKQSDVVVEEGELVEFGTRAEAKKKVSRDVKKIWWDMFQGYADRRGKSSKWVLAQFKSKFDEWPRGLGYSPIEPSAECLSWIRARNIAWAKRKERAA